MNQESPEGKGKGLGAPVAALFVTFLILAAAIAYISFSPKEVTPTSSSATATSTTQASTSHSSSSETTSTSSIVSTTSSSSSGAVTTFQSMPASSVPKPQVGVLDPTNGNIYVANTRNGTVSVISSATNATVVVLQVGNSSSSPLPPVFDPANGELYVALGGGDAVAVISGETVASTVLVGGTPSSPFFDPQNGDIYVPFYSSADFVSVISGATNTVVANITTGTQDFTGRVFDPANGDIYLTSDYDGEVFIISGATNTVVNSIDLNFATQCDPFSENPPNIPCSQAQDGPSPPVFDPANGDIYVSNGGGNTVSVISGVNNSLVTNVVVGGGSGTIINANNEVLSEGPGMPVIDSANGNVYVTHGFNVSVISSATNAVIATVKVGDGPNQPVFNPTNGDIYVPNWTQDVCIAAVCRLNSNLTVISGATNTVLATVRICDYPRNAFSSNGDVYVPCQDGTVWVVYSTTSQSSTSSSTTLASPGYCGEPPDISGNVPWVGNDYIKVVTDQGTIITNGTLQVTHAYGGDTSGGDVPLRAANGTGYLPLAGLSSFTKGYFNVTLVASYSNEGPCYTAEIDSIPANVNSTVYVTVSVPSGLVTIVTSNTASGTVTTTTTSVTLTKIGG